MLRNGFLLLSVLVLVGCGSKQEQPAATAAGSDAAAPQSSSTTTDQNQPREFPTEVAAQKPAPAPSDRQVRRWRSGRVCLLRRDLF